MKAPDANVLHDLPSELALRLEALKPILIRQGSVVPRKVRGYQLRYRVPYDAQTVRQRSLNLKTKEQAEQVKQLIETWREEAGGKPAPVPLTLPQRLEQMIADAEEKKVEFLIRFNGRLTRDTLRERKRLRETHRGLY